MKTVPFSLLLSLFCYQSSAQINFVEDLKNGGKDHQNNTITKLDRPYGMVVSSDDKHLYTACIDDNSVVVFERNTMTGKLVFVESLSANGSDQAGNTIHGLLGAVNLVMSEDGKHLYVAGLGNNMTVFSRNATSGILTYIEALGGAAIPSLDEPINIGMSPDGKSLYVTSRGSNAGSITVFSRNTTTGKLTFVEALIDNDMDQAGNLLDKIRKPYGVQVSGDNKYVYVASNQEASITLFSRNLMTGVLTVVDVVTNNGMDQAGNPIGGALFGSNNLDISDDDKFVYVTAFSGDAVSVFSRNTTTGVLTFLQTLENNTSDGSGNTIMTLNGPQVIFATNNRVYAATGVGRSVVVFERNPSSGLLSFIEAEVDEVGSVTLLNDPEGMTLSRDHKFIYAAGDEDDGITVFQDLQVPLPVELLYFKGKAEKNKANLYWETASEHQNEGFFLERTTEITISKWETLDFIKGQSDKLTPTTYQYTDASISNGNYYYRLRQKDFDGTTSFSPVIVLAFQQAMDFKIYPNPTHDLLFIDHQLLTENQRIRILSINGKVVKAFHTANPELDISDLSKGTYFLELEKDRQVFRSIFVKK